MKRFLSCTTLVSLFVWTLPLGAFIQSAQEEVACGGKRAFHMCEMMVSKESPASRGGAVFSNAVGVAGVEKSQGVSGNDFLPVSRAGRISEEQRAFHREAALLPRSPVLAVPAPVPKL